MRSNTGDGIKLDKAAKFMAEQCGTGTGTRIDWHKLKASDRKAYQDILKESIEILLDTPS